MAAGVGQRIDASDYASIKSKVDLVFGTGSGDTGYGQLLTSPTITPGMTISASDWVSLRADMVKARQHQTGVSVGTSNLLDGNNLLLPTAGSVITEELRNQYNLFSNTITTNKFLVANGQLTASDEVLITGTRSTAWNSTLTHTITITGSTLGDGSANNLRYFFNAGGSIKLTASRTGGSTTSKNTDWSSMLSTMGTIVFNYTQTTYTGTTGTGSAIGWYDLTTTNQVIFQQAGTAFTSNLYRVSARTNADRTQLILTIEFQDNDITAPDINVDGNLVSTVLQSRPVGSNVEVRTNIASQTGLDSATPNPTPTVSPINVMIVMDVSFSMDWGTTYNGTTSKRLSVAKQVASDLLDCLVATGGQVAVRVINFAQTASAVGTSWISVSSAKSSINGFTTRSGTDFIAATTLAQSAWESPGKLAGAKNYIYFISDGYQISFGSTSEATWKTFLNSKLINSSSYGIGDYTLDLTTMNRVAWNGENQTDNNAIVVSSTINCSINTQTPIYTIETIPPNITSIVESDKWYKSATQSQWISFLNTYGIWAGGATDVGTKSFTATFNVPSSSTYTVQYASDDNMTWRINSGTTYSSTFNVLNTTAVSLSAGTHTITVNIENTGGPAGAAITIVGGSTTYWSTLNQVGVSSGNTLPFLVKSFNTANETLFWNVTGLAIPADFVNGNGSITLSGNQATFTLSTVPDSLVEGNENFQVEIRKTSGTGPILVTSPTITLIDSTPIPVYTITPPATDPASTINESGSVTYTINVTNLNGSSLTWAITGTNITASDFSDGNGLTGNISINSDNFTTTIIKTLSADTLTEGTENFTLRLYKDNIEVAASRVTNVTDSSPGRVFAITANNYSSAISVNEGDLVVFRTVTNFPGPTQSYYWRLVGSAIADDFDSASEGTLGFSYNNDQISGTVTGTTSIFIKSDNNTEGVETFRYNLYSDSQRTILVASSPLITINDTSTSVPSYYVSSDNGYFNEGEIIPIYFTALNSEYPIIYWRARTGSGNVADFDDIINYPTSGSFTTSTHTVYLKIKNDLLTEGTETLRIEMYTDPNYSLNRLAFTNLYIADTSLTPVYSYTVSGPDVIFRGDVSTFTLTTNAPAGTILRWDIPTASGDFSTSTQGTVTVPASGVVVINLLPNLTGGNHVGEIFTLNILNNEATQTLATKSITVAGYTLTVPSINQIFGSRAYTFNIEITDAGYNFPLYWRIRTISGSNVYFSPSQQALSKNTTHNISVIVSILAYYTQFSRTYVFELYRNDTGLILSSKEFSV